MNFIVSPISYRLYHRTHIAEDILILIRARGKMDLFLRALRKVDLEWLTFRVLCIIGKRFSTYDQDSEYSR